MIPRFRAWEKELKEMIEVRNIHFEEGIVNYSTEENPLPWRFISEVVLMQSTGLYDKNGVEIFEGDILSRQFYINAIVSYDDGAFEQGWNCYRKHRLNQDFCSSREVIGNIYENKDLMEVES